MYPLLNQFKIPFFFLYILISFYIEANESQDSLKIGFGSCLDQDNPQEIWQPLKKENLHAFVFMGDKSLINGKIIC